RHGLSCFRHLCQSQAEIPLIPAVQISRASSLIHNWRHTITVEAVEDGNPSIEYPRFIDGERRAPPEDVGSTSGFEEFLNVMAKPRHAQHREFARWYGGRFGRFKR
ncbi:plasmid pRiA4b ORF-3 family protein, partial [Sinorhizobium medicae]|uniref:plasmid pRiA4b ORF-3 family protein n=1 Tax=Sinorhizobium medicae TaxID=110321 RepID=UPI0027DE46F4